MIYIVWTIFSRNTLSITIKQTKHISDISVTKMIKDIDTKIPKLKGLIEYYLTLTYHITVAVWND